MFLHSLSRTLHNTLISCSWCSCWQHNEHRVKHTASGSLPRNERVVVTERKQRKIQRCLWGWTWPGEKEEWSHYLLVCFRADFWDFLSGNGNRMDLSDVMGLNSGDVNTCSADLSSTRKFHMLHFSLCAEGDFLHSWWFLQFIRHTSPAAATQAEAWDCRIKEVGTSRYHFHCRMKGRSVTSHLCQITNTLWQPCLISKRQQQKMILCLRNLTVWEFYLKSYKGQLCFHLNLWQKV